MKRRKKHKASILQEKGSPCYLCMKMRPHYEWKRAVHEHHIFGGSNRDKSEAEGLKVYLCLEHHISGKEAVHNIEDYTDNVRRIIERSLHDLEAEPPYLTSFLCDPCLTEEDLETALHILEKAGTELTKQKLIKAELKTRREVVSPTEFPADLRQEWEDMREAVKRRKRNG